MRPTDLIYDWNRLPGSFAYTGARVEFNDETLGDGLQNPTVTDPPVEQKLEMLHLMVDMGIHSADIEPIVHVMQRTGLPLEVEAFIGSSPIRLCAEDWDRERLLNAIEEHPW